MTAHTFAKLLYSKQNPTASALPDHIRGRRRAAVRLENNFMSTRMLIDARHPEEDARHHC